ncbi:hypothetical protein M5689_002202 [Euphorbia peplus]|nr:hypothetical protein M5689_002202 [Euphorbia peplus]
MSGLKKSKNCRHRKTVKLEPEIDIPDSVTVNSLRSPFLSAEGYAELALKLYKEKHGSDHIDYRIVSSVGCCRTLAVVPGWERLGTLDCCHVSFHVRSSKVGSNKVLFFAELVDFRYGDDQLVLQNFSILKIDSSQITYGCRFCPPNQRYPHPREAFFVGEGDYMPTDDMAQKDMALLFEQELISNRKVTGTTYFNFKRSLAFLPEPFEEFVLDPSLRAPLFSTLAYAYLALELYKQEPGTMDDDYEIVDALGSYRVLSHVPKARIYEVVDWCHVSFTAKPGNSNCKDDIVLFFVELADFSRGYGLSLNYFLISKLGARDVTYGCGFCPPNENHPHIRNAHFAGLWDYKPTKVSSQKEMAICFQRQLIDNTNRELKFSLNCMRPQPVQRDPSCFSPILSDHEYAEIALSYINKVEENEFELVKAIYSNRQTCSVGINRNTEWCHVYFIGKCKQEVSRVHFFAELNDPGVKKFCLGAYSRMDPRGLDSRKGCGICPVNEKYRHPRDLDYSAGNWAHFGCVSHDNALLCTNCSRFVTIKKEHVED